MQAIQGWDVRCLQTTAGSLDGGSRDLHIDRIQILCEEYRNVTTNHSEAHTAASNFWTCSSRSARPDR
jgi:hypothetical protein